MTSDGERIERHVQLLRVLMTRDGVTFDEALAAAGPLVLPRIMKRSGDTTGGRPLRPSRYSSPASLSDGGPRAWFDEL